MADFIHVTPGFAVSGQLEKADFARAAAAGFRAIVNNRPDGEAPGQISSAEAAEAARAAGLGYWAAPTKSSALAQSVDAERAALQAAGEGPVLAYCRSGSRSMAIWALAQAQAGQRAADELIRLAAEAGYDIRGLRSALQAAEAQGAAQTSAQGAQG